MVAGDKGDERSTEQREEKRSEKRIYTQTHTHTEPSNVGKRRWCEEAAREW